MRILTVISGILLSAAGAFCLSFYTNAFSGLAFLLGFIMLLAGMLQVASFLLSGRTARLPDTVLVEGCVTFMFGFAVLNDQVMDTMLTIFFGAWLVVAGITRFSQGLAVSRFNPKDWAKILPLSLLSAIMGSIMLMQSLVSTANAMILVGVAFVLNGFSLLIYAMYMVKHEPKEKAEQARIRVEAKQAAAEAKRAERNQLRAMSSKEREEKKRAQREQKKAEAKALKEKKQAEKLAARASREPKDEPTIKLTDEESQAIIADNMEPSLSSEPDFAMIDELTKAVSAAAAEIESEEAGELKSPAEKPALHIEPVVEKNIEPVEEKKAEQGASDDVPVSAEPSFFESIQNAESSAEPSDNNRDSVAQKQEDAPKAEKTEAVSEEMSEAEPQQMPAASESKVEQSDVEFVPKWPTWQKPKAIPSIRPIEEEMSWDSLEKEPAWQKPLFPADAESQADEAEKKPPVVFEPVELPKVSLARETLHKEAEPVSRDDILQKLESDVKPKEQFTPFKPLTLDDLFEEESKAASTELPRAVTRQTLKPSDFTDEFSWKWPPKSDR